MEFSKETTIRGSANVNNVFKMLFFLSVFLFAAFIIKIKYFDSDTFFIIATGREMSKHGILYTNPFTEMEGLKIVVQQWLWCYIVYFFYNTFNNLGLMFLCFLEGLFIFTMFYQVGKENLEDKKLAFIFSLFFTFFLNGFISTRPNALTIGLLLWEILEIEKYYKDKKNRHLVLILLGQLLETNLHMALWSVHIMVFFAFLCSEFFRDFMINKKFSLRIILKLRKEIFVCFLLVLVPLINPYGINGWMYLFNSFNEMLTVLNIKELSPLKIISFASFLLFCCVVIIIKKIVKKETLNIFHILLFTGSIFISSGYIRNLYFLYIGMFLIIMDFLQEGKFYLEIKNMAKNIYNIIASKKLLYIPIIFVICVFIAFLSVFLMRPEIDYTKRNVDTIKSPIKAMEYIDKVDKNAAIYTEFNTGATFEFYGYKIFIDARPELFMKSINKKDDYLLDFIFSNCNGIYPPDMYEKFKNKHDFRFYFLEKNNMSLMSIHIQNDPEMELVIEGEEYMLFELKTGVQSPSSTK